MNICQLLADAKARIDALDADILLCHVLHVRRSYLLAHPEHSPDAAQQQHYQQLLVRRQAGEPVAYLLGEREFWSLPLKVTPATLIPRPETELLVELALSRLPLQTAATVIDLGTGSGAIALAIAHERPACHLIATDASLEALTVAKSNAEQLRLMQVNWLYSDWFSALHGQCADLIVSNPPYIAANDPHLQQGDVRFEPPSALISGIDGLDDIRHLIAYADEYLRPGGWLLLEHGYDQGPAVRQCFLTHGYQAVETCADLAGQARVTLGRTVTRPDQGF